MSDAKLTSAKLTKEQVVHIAELAKLELTDAEIETFAGQLSDILAFANRLQAIDTSAIEPMPSVLPLENVMRPDIPEPGLDNEEALANAPEKRDGFFQVRAVFE